MAKRIRLTSEDLVFPCFKRNKTSHDESGDAVFEDMEPSSAIDGVLIGSNGGSALDTEQLSPPMLPREEDSEESTVTRPNDLGLATPELEEDEESLTSSGNIPSPATPPTVIIELEELRSPTPEPEEDNENNEDSPPSSSNILLPVTPASPSSTTTPQNDDGEVSRSTQHQLLNPRSPTPAPKSEMKSEQQITKKQKKSKRSKTEPGFTIFEDETATCDYITQTEEECYSVAMGSVQEVVEHYIQKEGFHYGEEVIDWLLPLARKVDEMIARKEASRERETAREETDTLELQLLKWKQDCRFDYRQATRWSTLTHHWWFSAEGLEELADLVEKVFVTAEEGENEELKQFARKYARGEDLSKAFMVMGFCHAQGFVRERRRKEEFYQLLGEQLERIMIWHFVDDVAEMSDERVRTWVWHEKMMKKVLKSPEGWIKYKDILRARWANRHPSAAVTEDGATPLQDGPRDRQNRPEHELSRVGFENGVDNYEGLL